MGTQTLGNTAGGSSVQFWFQDTGSGVAVRGGDTLTAPSGGMYIDTIHVFGNSEGGLNNSNCRGGLFTTGFNLLTQTPTFTLGTTTTYYTASFATGSYYHVSAGGTFMGGILVVGGGGLRTWGRGDGGSWRWQTGLSSFPSPFSGGSAQTGLGNWPWYVTYFPEATVTGYKDPNGVATTVGYVGERLQVNGLSFSAGVTAVDFNGVAADIGSINVFSDVGLNINIPAGATTGPVHVTTNAGTGTGPTITIGSAYILRSSVWTSGPVSVERSGIETPAQGVLVYRSGSWVNSQ